MAGKQFLMKLLMSNALLKFENWAFHWKLDIGY
jgi:hypothetical protein